MLLWALMVSSYTVEWSIIHQTATTHTGAFSLLLTQEKERKRERGRTVDLYQCIDVFSNKKKYNLKWVVSWAKNILKESRSISSLLFQKENNFVFSLSLSLSLFQCVYMYIHIFYLSLALQPSLVYGNFFFSLLNL